MSEFPDMDAATLRQALDLVRRHTGVTMVPAKQSMLQTRLRQRMRALKLDSYEAYLKRVQEDESEWQSFIDAVTTHHTSFFRTPRIWRYLREEFMPGWLERHPGGALRVWSAAAISCSCATCSSISPRPT
jgi:chemotaxis protein methyltransferase CheR